MSALEAIVKHFQQLFGVSSVGGIYPTMSKIYQLVQESSTAHKQLAAILTTGLHVDCLFGEKEMGKERENRSAKNENLAKGERAGLAGSKRG